MRRRRRRRILETRTGPKQDYDESPYKIYADITLEGVKNFKPDLRENWCSAASWTDQR